MAIRRSFAAVAILALVAACGGAPSATPSLPVPGASAPQPAGGASTVPASTSEGPVSTPPTTTAGSTITGTIEFRSHAETYQTDTELKTDVFDATIVVSLVRDPSDPAERYIDSGSTYRIDALFHGERNLGNCTSVTERKSSDSEYAFTDQPTSYPNSIEAVVNRAAGSAKFEINVSWPYVQTVGGCQDDSTFEWENASGLGCTGLGLDGKLVEGSTGTEIDMACTSLHALTTVSGVLTIGG